MSLPDILVVEETVEKETIISTETPTPITPTVSIVEDKREGIKRELERIDLLSIRPLRARLFDTATSEDEERLTKLENRARDLRQQLEILSKDVIQSILNETSKEGA